MKQPKMYMYIYTKNKKAIFGKNSAKDQVAILKNYGPWDLKIPTHDISFAEDIRK
jgi:hypothetical protein